MVFCCRTVLCNIPPFPLIVTFLLPPSSSKLYVPWRGFNSHWTILLPLGQGDEYLVLVIICRTCPLVHPSGILPTIKTQKNKEVGTSKWPLSAIITGVHKHKCIEGTLAGMSHPSDQTLVVTSTLGPRTLLSMGVCQNLQYQMCVLPQVAGL